MATSYIKELSPLTQLASAYGIEIDTGAASGYSTLETLLTYNSRYKIVPSVSSNDLTVSIKTVDGNNASATDAIPFKIGNTIRWCTAALSVTKADGTNWANLGSAEIGTKEVDLFTYACWNTNTGAVDVFWARIPYGRLYSDFSATTTDEKYAAINATAPASTDECVLIGRFAATLSLSGTSHLWTVPTFTNTNLIHHPVYTSRWLSWLPAYTGFSSNPTGTETYKVFDDIVYIHRDVSANGTSNDTVFTMTFPFKFAVASAIYSWVATTDNGATGSTPGHLQATSGGSNVGSMFKTFYQGAWTNTGAKNVYLLDFNYRIR